MEVVFLIIVIVVAAVIWSSVQSERAKEQAKQKYLAALAELKITPTNADVKQRTLALGRHYSALTRNKKGVSLFDEMALMNDINAACAAANVTAPPSAIERTPAVSIETRLRTLSDLRDKGLVASEEYETRRNEILASI